MTISNTAMDYRRSGNINDFGYLQSSLIYDATITSAGGAKSITVPGSGGSGASVPAKTTRFIAIFKVQTGKTVVMSNGSTAVINGTATFGTTASELLNSGDAREVVAGDVLSFLTSDTSAYVNVVLYRIP